MVLRKETSKALQISLQGLTCLVLRKLTVHLLNSDNTRV
jgi:hypothetical protein